MLQSYWSGYAKGKVSRTELKLYIEDVKALGKKGEVVETSEAMRET